VSSQAIEAVVATVLHLVQGYLLAGVAFGMLFVIFGVQRVDPEARHWPNLGFRLLLLPGLSVFWPLFAVRWWRGSPPPRERTAHRAIVKP
jgi:hypothetical protein